MFNRLKFRIFLLMIVVSVPAAALVVFLAYRTFLIAQRVELSTFSTSTEVLSLHVESSLASSKSLVATLAETLPWNSLAARTCDERLTRVLNKNAGQAALFIFKNGRAFCGHSNVADLTLASFPFQGAAGEETGSGFYASPNGKVAIWISRRAQENSDTYTIFSLSDDAFLEGLLRDREGGNGRFSALVTDTNRMVATSSEQATRIHMPVLLDAGWTQARTAKRTIDGNNYIYVSYPLTSLKARIVAAQPERLLYAASGNQLYLAVLTSILLLFLPVAAIWWGVDRLVLRWLSHYSQVTAAYAQGDQQARMRDPSSDIPVEIARVATSFNAMADSVAARTAELEEEIKRKQTYVRELHHRVKNILQMIASMLAMEAREAGDAKSEGIARSSRRIAALGATYAIFYGYSERGKAPLATVLNEAISRLGLGAPVRAVNYEASGDFDIGVDLDLSIAITMLLAEFISAYLESNEMGSVSVSTYIGKVLEVYIDAPHRAKMSGLGHRFVKAYLRQLDASHQEEGNSMSLKIKLSGMS